MADYNILGLVPVQTGEASSFGNSWFLFDQSGTFSVDKDLNCTVYLVGGGCNGTAGTASKGNYSRGGAGGDGGCVYIARHVKIPKNTNCEITVAEANDKTGTVLSVSGNILNCDDSGYVSTVGGQGGYLYWMNASVGYVAGNSSARGVTGITTPYGVIGSSGGGGGVSCTSTKANRYSSPGGTGAGTGGKTSSGDTNFIGGKAENYGCGGGGGGARTSSSAAQGYSGGSGKKGCIIFCVINEAEIPEIPDLIYNGTNQYPFGENGIEHVVITGDLSGIAAGEYNAVLTLEDGYFWADGTTDPITVEWQIKKAAVPKPVVEPLEFEYSGRGTYNSTNYKFPEITGFDSNIMTKSGDGTSRKYKAGTYPIVFALKDKESAAWTDGSVEDFTVDWVITPKTAEIPVVVSEDFVYDGKYHGAVVENFDLNIMTQTGNGGTLVDAGNYSITYALRDPDSCSWEDGTTEPKTVYWNINKKTETVEKPYLAENQREFDYDGVSHTPVISGRDNNTMSFSGDLSSTAAGNKKILVTLKNNANIVYQWADGSDDVLELDWTVKKAEISVPVLGFEGLKYDGTSKKPNESGYNSNVMTRGAKSVLSAVAAGEYSVVYSLKDKNSASWEDGSTDDKTVTWKIAMGDQLAVPSAASLKFTYDGQQKTPVVSGYNSSVMTRKGTTYATNAGKYYITFSLKDSLSVTWADGSIADKTIDWEIEKAVVQYEKPFCNTEYVYNGTTRTATFTNFNSSVMNSTGRSAVKAGNYTAVFSLKTSSNYIYQWTDGTIDDVEVDWIIKKLTGVAIPTISQNLYYYGGWSWNGSANTFTYRYPAVSGFNSDIMDKTGVSEGYWNSNGMTFVTTKGRWYCGSQYRVGKYYASFWFKDPDSCEWEDGTSGKITYEWSIVREIKLLPKVYIENKRYEYDGTAKTPVVVNKVSGVKLSGNLSAAAEGNYIITAEVYRWEKESYPNGDRGTLGIYDFRWEDNTIDNIYLDWQISNGSIIIPSIASTNFVYDGLPHFPVVGGFDKNTMTISGEEKIAAKEYEVVFSLKDPDSGTWNDGSVEDKVFKWSISKTTVGKPSISPDFMEYDGEAHTVEFVENDSDHSFIVSGFDSNIMDCSGDVCKVNVGNYCVVIALKDPDSCTWADGSVDPVELPWEIRKKTVLLDKPYLSPEKFLYDGMAYSPEIVGFKSLGMVVKSGSVVSAVAAGEYKIVLALREDPNITYLWGDAEQNFIDGELELSWEIEKAVGENAVKIPVVSPLEFVYDGGVKKPEISECNNSVISVSGVVSAYKAGEYEIIFALKDKNSCEWENGSTDDIVVKWEIKKQGIGEKPYLRESGFVFNGKSRSPEIINFDASRMVVSGDVRASAAGEYVLVVTLKDGFQWTDGSADEVRLSWEITKLSVDIPRTLDSEFVYNGLLQAPSVEYDSVFVTFDGDIGAVAAGDYSIVFSLIDKNSCYWADGSVDDITYEWKIGKLSVNIPNAAPLEFVYDGELKTPEISKYDANVISQSGVSSAVNSGEYSVIFSLKDKNSASWTDGSVNDVVFEWKIGKARVEKPYIQSDVFLYDGEIYAPNIIGFDSDSMVMSGDLEKKDPGNYTLVIKLLKNYEWSDGTSDDLVFPWVIKKVIEVVSVAVPNVDGILFQYNGAVYSPKIGEFDGGIISVSGAVSAVNAGNYTIKFSLKDKERYIWENESSEDISVEWKIEKIKLEKPVAVNLNYVYNGGYHLPVVHGVNEKYMIATGNAKQVNAGKYRCVIAIRDKINYIWEDGSDSDIFFNWEITRKLIDMPYLDRDLFEYDGKNKTPVIKNFNSEIMEIVYVSNGERISNTSAANVGKYKIVILLGVKKYENGVEYYQRNFQWTDGTVNNLVLNWEIGKGKLKYPVILVGSFVYNGRYQSPVLDGFISDIMNYTGVWSRPEAGEYKVGFTLKSTDYEWEDPGDDGKLLDWEITRKPLSKILDAPYKKSDLTYNGYSQSPIWMNYDVRVFTISGESEAVNVGEYTAKFIPTKNYMWDDGTVEPLGITWKIERLALKIPTQGNALYYTGYELRPTWNDAFKFGINWSGELSGILAGEYSAHCECNENCYFAATNSRKCDVFWEILKKKLKAPTAKLPYPYTGEEIIAEFNNYDPEVLSASGDLSGVNVGDYAAYFDIKDKDNYTWAENVFTNKNGYAGVSWKIVSSRKVVKVPYQNNTLIYNGEKLSPLFANFYSSFMMIVGGSISEIYAGKYSVTFRLKDNTVWEDGTTEDKVVVWEIEKKVLPCPYISVSVAEGGMYYYEIEGKRYPVWGNFSSDDMTMSGDTYDIDGEWHVTSFELKDPYNFSWSCAEGRTFTINWKLSAAYLPEIQPGSGAVRVHIPRQIRIPYEDGFAKYPEWDSFNNTAIMKIGGVWEGISADTYYVILELREGYIWEDGTAEIKAVPWKILEIGEKVSGESELLEIHIPEQINIPYYDGYVKEPEWDIWDKYGFDIVNGELYGVLAGVYYLVLRLQTGYIWEDGTLEEKTVMWVIEPSELADVIEIPDDGIPMVPEPEKEGDEDLSENGGNGRGNGNGCCCCCSEVFDILKNSCDDKDN